MSELDQFIKAMAEGIRAFSRGIEIFADQLDEYAAKTPSEETAEPEQKGKADTEQSFTGIKNDIQSTPAEKREDTEKKSAAEKEKISEKPRGNVKTKAKSKKKTRANTDTGKIYQLIADSDQGIDVGKLSEETGFDRQKIYGIISNLKKQDKIKNVKKGVYEPI